MHGRQVEAAFLDMEKYIADYMILRAGPPHFCMMPMLSRDALYHRRTALAELAATKYYMREARRCT